MEPGDSLLGPGWFRELGQDWFRALARRRRAPATIATYRTALRQLGRWLEDEGVDAPSLLNRQHLQLWQDSLVDQVSPKSQALYTTAVRGLMRWAGREERVQPGLADWIDPVEVPERQPLVLEREQLAAALAHFRPPRRDLVYLRDRALFYFLLTSSARIKEALQLDLVDVDRRRWVVTQKGGGQKTLVISAVAREWLAQ